MFEKNNDISNPSNDPEDITIEEVLKTMVGIDSDGDAKAVVYLSLFEIPESEDDDPQVLKRLILHNTYLSDIGFPGCFVMAELEFKLMSNIYRKSFCEMITEFHHMENNDEKFGLIMSVASLRDDAGYVLSFDCPLICVQGFSDSSKAPTKLQVVFPLEGFNLYPANYSLAEIRAEVGREMDEESQISSELMNMVDSTKSDIDDQIKELYGINDGIELPRAKKDVRSSLG